MYQLKPNIWQKQSDFVQKNDSYQENDPLAQGRGIFQRYLEANASEIDAYLIPKIANLGVYTHSPTEILDTIVPIREASLGLYAPFYIDIDLRKKCLQYLPIVMRMRGTLQNYIFLLGLLGFDVTLNETIDTGGWDSGTWDNGRWDSYANINGNADLVLQKRHIFVTTPELIAQIEYILEWNCPINCSCTYTLIEFEPVIDVSPDTLNFGNVIEGENDTLQFTIFNTGVVAMNVTSITLPNIAYSVDWSSGVVPASGSQVVNITFSPTTVGGYSGLLSVVSDATIGDNQINLVATAITATRIVDVSPTTLAFGTVISGQTNTLQFTINNTGNSTLNVTSITLPSIYHSVDFTSGSIASGGSQVVNITFAPTVSGVYNGDIVVNSNATSIVNNTISTTSTANGTLYPIGNGLFGDGVNDYVQTDFNIVESSDYTFAFWLKTNNTAQNKPIFGNGNVLNFNISAKQNATALNFSVTKPGITYPINVPNVFTTTAPIHIALVYANTSLSVYLNGALLSSTTIPAGNLRPENVFMSFFRDWDTANYWDGVFYDAKFFNSALNATQISSLHNLVMLDSVLGNLVFDMRFESITTSLGSYFTPAVLGNQGQLFGYVAGATGIVSATPPYNNVQLVP